MSFSSGTAIAGDAHLKERPKAPESRRQTPETGVDEQGAAEVKVSADPLFATDKYRRAIPLYAPEEIGS